MEYKSNILENLTPDFIQLSPSIKVDVINDRVAVGPIQGATFLSRFIVKSTGDSNNQIVLQHSGNGVPIVGIGQESSHGSLQLRLNSGATQVRLSAINNNYILPNLGIGVTGPLKKLHVKESTTATYAAYIENSIAGGDYLAMIGDAGDPVFEFDSGGTGGEAQMKMYSDNVLKNLLDANGSSYFSNSVGIGVSSPQAKLEIGSSSGAASGQYNSPSALLIGTSAGSAGAGGTLLFGADGSSASDIQWSISNNNTGSNATGSVGNLNFNTKDTLAGTILSPAMTILPGGNVGIGTTTPASELEVSGRISGGELGSSDVCRNGLLFYVDFNDKACVSGTLATEVPIDLGPQNLQMSLVGGANFEYKNGIGCYYFDGSNDHILIQDYVVADTVNSYEIWHYAVAQATYETWWDSGTERPLLGTYNDDLIAYPAYNTTSLGDKINLNKWYHVVWAMNGNTDMDIFVNGKRTHEGLGGNMGQRTGTFSAMLGGDTSAETTNGFIAITRTYSRQLTPEDVLQNYNAEVERFAPVTPSLGIVQSYGNVGIGIIPGDGFGLERLSLGTGAFANEAIVFAPSSGGNAEFINTSSTGTFTFSNADGSSEMMRIKANNYVGIGTTLPNAMLHVKSTATTSQIKMSAASNAANFAYLTMTDNTVNTARLTFGTTQGYNVPINALSIFDGAVRFDTYGAGTLVSDASGNITASGGSQVGPFLPLAGGNLTGNLTL